MRQIVNGHFRKQRGRLIWVPTYATQGPPQADLTPTPLRMNAIRMESPESPRLYVEVYRNVNKKCWSVRANGRVICHAQTLILEDCNFAVQQAGQRKVRETGRKNVHAFVRGYLVNIDIPMYKKGGPKKDQVFYNPKRDDTFVTRSGQPVLKAERVCLLEDGSVFRKGDEND